MAINFFSHKIKFQLNNKSVLKKWIELVVKKEKKQHNEINYVFCDDEYLLEINRKYLKHNFLTDIITFNFSEIQNGRGLRVGSREQENYKHQTASAPRPSNSELYISIPRVKENAKKFNVSFENELMRVMVHGVLHLCGYNDKTKKEKEIMRKKENEYLLQFSSK